MTTYPYKLICKKCGVEFPSKTPQFRLCSHCKSLKLGKFSYPKLFYKNRKIVFTRDENKCQCCGCNEDGQTTNKLIVHHIDVDTENNSPSNLITLCCQCHHSLHEKYGKFILRRSSIYKLFSKEKTFGEFGKVNIYDGAKKIVKRQFKGSTKLFFKT